MVLTFLDLPPKIRNAIYNLVIPAGQLIIKRPALRPEDLKEPAIAAMSHQVRRETLSIHYASYIFQAEYLYQCIAFVELLGPARAAMLTEFRVCEWDEGTPHRIQEMLDCVRRDRDCRLKGVRKEAVFVPVAPGKFEKVIESGHSMLWKTVRMVVLGSSSI
jgi:hypothetical protein